MSKRGAIRDINHDNWDQEEEPEDPGVFKQAGEDVLKRREIKKAKRRGLGGATGDAEGGGGGTSAFKGFSGFTSMNPKPTFAFNTDSSKPLGIASSGAGFSNGGSAGGGGSGLAPFSLGSKPAGASFSFGAAQKPLAAVTAAKSDPDKSSSSSSPAKSGTTTTGDEGKEAHTKNGSTSSSSSRTRYLQQLKALNEGVSKWITEHVSRNAHCVLTPIFRDYEQHLAEVEKLNPDHEEDGAGAKTTTTSTTNTTSSSGKETEGKGSATTWSASSQNASKPTSANSSSGGASSGVAPSPFAAITTTSSSFSASTFSFKPSTTSSTSSSLPPISSSLGSKPFSFAAAASAAAASAAAAATSAAATANDEEEEYVPPKAEVQEIKEDDAFYSKRCKLFYQKEGNYVDLGVGNLHLKPCGEKTQLIVRADTNLGNIILNIMLLPSIPLVRQGKNNVSMMCVPNPPIDKRSDMKDKPVPMLIRVKTADEADELLKTLEDNKK